jgi:hypothetical protein
MGETETTTCANWCKLVRKHHRESIRSAKGDIEWSFDKSPYQMQKGFGLWNVSYKFLFYSAGSYTAKYPFFALCLMSTEFSTWLRALLLFEYLKILAFWFLFPSQMKQMMSI